MMNIINSARVLLQHFRFTESFIVLTNAHTTRRHAHTPDEGVVESEGGVEGGVIRWSQGCA